MSVTILVITAWITNVIMYVKMYDTYVTIDKKKMPVTKSVTTSVPMSWKMYDNSCDNLYRSL